MSNQNHFDEERIVSAVLSFINAKTWAESKAIVQAHQNDLLTPATIHVFEVLLTQHRDNESAIRVLEDRRSLLLRCQSEGIDAAFADRLLARYMPDIPPELLARLKAIRSEEEFRELIEEHPELLPVIQQIVKQSQVTHGSSADISNSGELPALLQELQGLNRPSDMPRRVELCQRALTLVNQSAQPKLWAGLQMELGSSLGRNPLGPRAENLELAIEHYNQALEVYTREAFPEDWDWAAIHNNLAAAYSDRIRGERAENLELAIKHYNRALEVRTRKEFQEDWAATQNNLAAAYSNRIRGERAENIARAIEHYNRALEVMTLDRFPADRRLTLRNMGDLRFFEQSWENALANYNRAIEAGKAVLAEAHTEVGRKAEVGETSRLYARSAYCLLKLKQTDEAVLRLEEGKARLLAEALALANADLDMLSVTQRKEMSEAREAVRLLEAEMRLSSDVPSRRSGVELGDLLRGKRTCLNELVDTLRSEHPDFMPKGLELPGILGLIPEGGALVAPLVTSKGSAVFVIPHGANSVESDHVVMLDSLTEVDVLELLRGPVDVTGLGGWMGAYVAFLSDGRKAAVAQWLDMIEESTGKLWTLLMGPVHKKLQDMKLTEAAPVTLMPQGYLGLLPLHAAWRDLDDERRAFIDNYTVTYAPSAYSLKISKSRMQETSRQKPSLLAVINPTEDLRYALVEGMAVEAMFNPDDRQTLLENKATKETVVKEVPGWTYLHFSCHGFYNWQDVMGSGLMLANHEILTLSEIISGLNLDKARLVTLSACETGMTDIQQSPDEFIGLPTGFLQAGAAGVVSTLWAVNDATTSLLIKHFYRKHLKDGVPPGQALRSAQLWLRGATREELGDTYNKFIDRMSHREAYRELVLGGDPGDKPYANPYYWAAFTFTGI
jgi:CHAT domain-containing protein/tetratricopeptide (TPR) repeat protein